jgi:hypothetical protein
MSLVAAMAGGYLLRRQGLRWGVTDEEVHKPLPGDEVVSHPMLETTHAVTIEAPAEEIWPWLVQMGYYRAGFYADPSWWDKYSDKYLRSLSHKEAEQSGYGFQEIPSDERIIPEFRKVGANNSQYHMVEGAGCLHVVKIGGLGEEQPRSVQRRTVGKYAL